MEDKITYKLEYNKNNEMWCIFKYVEGYHHIGFRAIYKNADKNKCIEKLKEVKHG